MFNDPESRGGGAKNTRLRENLDCYVENWHYIDARAIDAAHGFVLAC